MIEFHLPIIVRIGTISNKTTNYEQVYAYYSYMKNGTVGLNNSANEIQN